MKLDLAMLPVVYVLCSSQRDVMMGRVISTCSPFYQEIHTLQSLLCTK